MRTAAPLLFFSLASCPAFAGCGPDSSAAVTTASASSIRISKPIFAVDDSSKLLRRDPARGAWHVVSDHGFYGTPDVVPSPDGRWFSYSGETPVGYEYWLYAIKTGQDRLLHRAPKAGISTPEFSPNGQWIALFANYDRSYWRNARGEGLYLFEVKSGHKIFLENPSQLPDPVTRSFRKAVWSLDGKVLLMEIDERPPGAKSRSAYFAYLIGERRYEGVSGVQEPGNGSRFMRGTRIIAIFEGPRTQSVAKNGVLRSPDGTIEASIGSDHRLTLSRHGGAPTRVADGEYDQCSGVTIGINGWLDARHLVYTLRNRYHVYEVDTGKDAFLLDRHVMVVLW